MKPGSSKVEHLLMPNTYLRHLAQEIRDHERLMEGTGIPPVDLENYTGTVIVAQTLQFLRNAISIASRPDWYLHWAKRMAEHFHGPITVAWLSAPTLGDGLDVFLQYMPSRIPYLDLQGRHDGAYFRCELHELMDFGICRPLLIEIPILLMHEYVDTIRCGSLEEAAVQLRYPATPYQELYRYWFNCPLEFSATRNAFVIPHAWRAIRNAGYDEATWRATLRRLEASRFATREREALGSVRETLFEIFEENAGNCELPTLEAVAARLHVSRRTLIRRLGAIGTTFQEVLDDVQKRRACELLASDGLRLHEISAVLGYRDPASFGRTFKRWFGMTPGAYRRQLPARGS